MSTLQAKAREIASLYFPNKNQETNRNDLEKRIVELSVEPAAGDETAKIDELAAKITELTQELEGEKATHGTTKHLLEVEEEAHANKTSLLDEANARINDLENQISGLKSEVAAKDEEIAKLTQETAKPKAAAKK